MARHQVARYARILALALLALALAQQQNGQQRLLSLIASERGELWIFAPTLDNRELASQLRRRVQIGLPTTILVPFEERLSPISFSESFFFLQLFNNSFSFDYLNLERYGLEIIAITGQEVYLDGVLVEEDEKRQAILDWWRRAWQQRMMLEPMTEARRLMFGR